MTPTFTDRNGNMLKVEITGRRLTLIRKTTGVAIGELLPHGSDQLVKLAYQQPEAFINVLYFLTGSHETSESGDDFSDRFNAEAMEGARLAVVDAVANFSLPPAISKAYIAAWRKLFSVGMTNLAKTITNELDRLASSEPATNSPASSESR